MSTSCHSIKKLYAEKESRARKYARYLVIGTMSLSLEVSIAHAAASDVLLGEWIQAAGGERLKLDKDNKVTFLPVVGSDEIIGTFVVAPSPQGGNLTVKLKNGPECIYLTTILENRNALNLKLLAGPSAKSAENGCVYGIFVRSEKWPDGEATATSDGQSVNSPNEITPEHSQLSVKSVKYDLGHLKGSLSGRVNFEWTSGSTVMVIEVPFSNVADRDQIVRVASDTLSRIAPSLTEAITGLQQR